METFIIWKLIKKNKNELIHLYEKLVENWSIVYTSGNTDLNDISFD